MVALNHINPADQPDPTPEVLAWCENLVRITKDGAVWGIPRSGTTFKIDQANKRLILVIPGRDDYADFYATKHNFGFIGWDVVTIDEVGDAQENAE